MRISDSEMECLEESLYQESYLDFARQLRLDEKKQNLARALDGCRNGNSGGLNDKYA
jgi:hypothetical protein